ncbi:MAG: hypothetical protein QWI36_00325 [Wolbachia endosymbiont of Tyrophagus putrescentiae]|nr:hypothetical protein [Wolbachia endosymbiont of Tyrophagus putrescentiae]
MKKRLQRNCNIKKRRKIFPDSAIRKEMQNLTPLPFLTIGVYAVLQILKF